MAAGDFLTHNIDTDTVLTASAPMRRRPRHDGEAKTGLYKNMSKNLRALGFFWKSTGTLVWSVCVDDGWFKQAHLVESD